MRYEKTFTSVGTIFVAKARNAQVNQKCFWGRRVFFARKMYICQLTISIVNFEIDVMGKFFSIIN